MSYPASTSDTNKPVDSKQERLVTEYLSKYLYAKAYPRHEVIESREQQLQGVDVVVSTDCGAEYHDIRAQVSKYYINRPLSNFSLELLLNSNNDEHVGWFLKPEMLTNVYVLVWVNKAKTNTYGYIDKADDIEELDVMFIDKRDLKEFVNNTMYDEALYDTARHMRIKGTKRLFLNEAMYISYSDQLKEPAVHLVVQKYALDKLAYQRFIVRKDSISVMT